MSSADHLRWPGPALDYYDVERRQDVLYAERAGRPAVVYPATVEVPSRWHTAEDVQRAVVAIGAHRVLIECWSDGSYDIAVWPELGRAVWVSVGYARGEDEVKADARRLLEAAGWRLVGEDSWEAHRNGWRAPVVRAA